MKKFYKTALPILGGFGSIAMIYYAANLLNLTRETTGVASVGCFLLGAVLSAVGLFIFCKVDKALSKL